MMMLVDKDGNLVELGTKIKCFRGEEHTLIGYNLPRQGSASTGRVIVKTKSGMTREFFPSVFDLKIIQEKSNAPY